MIGHSEFPAASYDAWKTCSPYDDYDDYEPREDCDHADADVDWEGYVQCPCGERWMLTAEQLEDHNRRQEEAERAWEREQQLEHDLIWLPWRAWRWCKARYRRWRNPPPKIDDEIPF